MGRAARWLRGLLGSKKPTAPATDGKPEKEKKRWGFVRSSRDKDKSDGTPVEARRSYREGGSKCSTSYDDDAEQSRHAIAVAAATAAVAEAAVAAAQAAAAVVRLTSSGRGAPAAYIRAADLRKEEKAAVKIQSMFRSYLARRALKALKALVKLQALVRGYLTRKHAVENLRYLEAIVRVQTRARSNLTKVKDGAHCEQKYLHLHPAPATPEKYESTINTSNIKHVKSSAAQRTTKKAEQDGAGPGAYANQNWLDSWMDEQGWDRRVWKSGAVDDENSAKILEVDNGNSYPDRRLRNGHFPWASHSTILTGHGFTEFIDSPSKDSTTAQLSVPSPSTDDQSLSPLRFPAGGDEVAYWTADNSPQFYPSSSRPGSSKKGRGPFTPAKSECCRSFLAGYTGYPNYMANTESSKAKVRSQSAPKQRPVFEKSGSTKRFSIHGFGDGSWGAGTGVSSQRSSAPYGRFANKAYPGSGRLDRLGMPLRDSAGV